MLISGAVEGFIDEAVLRRLITHIGAQVGFIYGKNGKDSLRKQINGYNQAALRNPWVVLIDLDQDADCAPPLMNAWLPQPAPYLCFRIAVREIETWLLADQERIARFLGVPKNVVHRNPEDLANPKKTIVDLASRSRKRAIREDMVPKPGSGRPIGPAYTSRLIEFAQDVDNGWRPDIAAKRSDSLARCLKCLIKLMNTKATCLGFTN